MRYHGGKARGSKYIETAILSHTTERRVYVEPFLGGGSSFAMISPHFERAYAGDSHEDLMLMWQALKDGWIPPESVSKVEYQRLRRESPSAMRGFVGFGCSFGGKWWGGYAKEIPGKYTVAHAASSLKKKSAQVSRAVLRHCSYDEWRPKSGHVVYCDPPYAETTGYYQSFDHEMFWSVMDSWHESGAEVFVSEYRAPAGWVAVAETIKANNLGGGTGRGMAEKLFAKARRPK